MAEIAAYIIFFFSIIGGIGVVAYNSSNYNKAKKRPKNYYEE